MKYKKFKHRRDGDSTRRTLRKVARSAAVLLSKAGEGLVAAAKVWGNQHSTREV